MISTIIHSRIHRRYVDPGNLLSAEAVCCGFRSLSCSTRYTAVVPSTYSTIRLCPFLRSAPTISKSSSANMASPNLSRFGCKQWPWPTLDYWTTTKAPIASSSVAIYSRNIPTTQSRLVRIPAVEVELLRRVSLASMFPISITAEERFCSRSCRGLGVCMWITFGQ